MADSGVIYGESGVFKSTACKHFSHYIYETTGKATLALSTDGGGASAVMKPEIEAGIVHPYTVAPQLPLPIIRCISKGMWPKEPEETDIRKIDMRRVDWEKFGGMIVEGLSSMSAMIMRHLADDAIKTGEEATSKFAQEILIDGQLQRVGFAGNSKGHYGFTQNNLYGVVMNFLALPCRYVLFTALEARAEEDDRTTIYGPQVAGKAATAKVPSWLGDCLHSQSYPEEKVVKLKRPNGEAVESKIVEQQVRTYFVKHPDPSTGIFFPAKPRITSERWADLRKAFPGGFYEPTTDHGFDTYLHTIDKLGKAQADVLRKWRQEMDAKFGRGIVPPSEVPPSESTKPTSTNSSN